VFVRPNEEQLQEIDTAFKWLLRQVGIKDFRIHDYATLVHHGW
jgi:hypothetical protein